MLAEAGRVVRLRVPLELSLRRLYGDAGYRVTVGRPHVRRQSLVDTPDRRLAAAGGDLRSDARGGWTWRRTGLGHPRLNDREWPATGTDAAEQAQRWTRAYARGRELRARSTVRAVERRHTVNSGETDTPLLAIEEQRLDEQLGDAWVPRLRRIGVTVLDDSCGGKDALAVLAGLSTADVDAPLAAIHGRQVRAPGLRLPDEAATDVATLLRRSLGMSMIQWLYFDSELRAGKSTDAVKKIRVALRRLRSDLVTFRPLIVREWADVIRADLAGLAARTGGVRDAEVRLERLDALLARLSDAERTAGGGLRAAAAAGLAEAQADLLAVLDGDEYLDLLQRTIAAIGEPRWIDHDGDQTPDVTALVRRPWRRLSRFVRELPEAPDDEALHRVRILAKRARYAADAAVPAYRQAAAHSAAMLAELQTVLGDHHDAAVNRRWLAEQAGLTPALGFVAGQLAALETANLTRAASEWADAWRAASRRKDWRWLRS